MLLQVWRFKPSLAPGSAPACSPSVQEVSLPWPQQMLVHHRAHMKKRLPGLYDQLIHLIGSSFPFPTQLFLACFCAAVGRTRTAQCQAGPCGLAHPAEDLGTPHLLPACALSPTSMSMLQKCSLWDAAVPSSPLCSWSQTTTSPSLPTDLLPPPLNTGLFQTPKPIINFNTVASGSR